MVVKVGSALLAGQPEARRAFAEGLATDIARLRTEGAQAALVSSGAVALGRGPLGLDVRRALTLPEKQAAAAAGQARLIALWAQAFAPHGIEVAQLLLTRDDTETRRRWLNARATTDALLRLGAVPVINENDTVAVDELRYGDNDRLAARVAQMIGGDLLVILSDVDGLYTADPRSDPTARRLDEVAELTPEVTAMAGGANAEAGVGSGGMASKLAAAAIARESGCATVIAQGWPATGGSPLAALDAGAGRTRIAPRAAPRTARKAWIVGRLDVAGALVVDEGAARALRSGASLLGAGVAEVRGDFGRGDPVTVLGADGRELARGLVRHDAATVRSLVSQRAPRGGPRPELIHADDLVVLEVEPPL